MEHVTSQISSLRAAAAARADAANLRIRRAIARLDAIVYRIIRERRAAGGDRGDVLSMLLAGAGRGRRQRA